MPPQKPPKQCAQCAAEFNPKNSIQRFCGNNCNRKFYRNRSIREHRAAQKAALAMPEVTIDTMKLAFEASREHLPLSTEAREALINDLKVAKETGELPPAPALRLLLRYDPSTGQLFWRERPVELFVSRSAAYWWNDKFAGKVAFASSNKGYLQGAIFCRILAAHRVIWALVFGEWPAEKLSREDGDQTNNRVENLRVASKADRLMCQKLNSTNTSGRKGVSFHMRDNHWRAQISIGNKNTLLGSFNTKEEAIAARSAAEVTLRHLQTPERNPAP